MFSNFGNFHIQEIIVEILRNVELLFSISCSELCHDGVIVTDGGGLFDLRTLFTRVSKMKSV